MKIVQALGWYHPDSLGGSEVYVAALCRRLKAAGHETLVVAPDAVGERERQYQHEDTRVFRYPIPPRPSRRESQGRGRVRGAERLDAWFRRERPDVVHVHSLVTGLGLAEIRAARAAGARVFFTSHTPSLGFICQRGSMMRWGRYLCDGVARPAKCAGCALEHRGLPSGLASVMGATPPGLSGVLGRLPGKPGTALGMPALIAWNQQRQRELMTLVERFVVLTNWALETAVANGAPRERLVLSPLGVEPAERAVKARREARPTGRPVRVGYLGRFEPIKGVHDLVRAVVSVPPATPLSLTLTGPVLTAADRAVLGDLQRLAAGDPRVGFGPAVRPDEAPEVLAGYDVLCCPSRCVEGGPTVAMEAHAVGTPVVGTRLGGLAERVVDGVNGRLVPAGDWRALAAVLQAIAADPAGTVDRWRTALPPTRTMDEVAAEHLALYREACAMAPAGTARRR
jgi:glycosyltransferase involved in cell wall biosynthesis